ncbi:head decoration protein [bacterium]|nr:head decoration protein [bacterium]
MSTEYVHRNVLAEPLSLPTRPVVLKSGVSYLEGAVLGRIKKAKGAVAATVGNTGNGAISGTSIGAKAEIGTYTLTCVEAVGNAGRFEVVTPSGQRLKDLTVAVAYETDHINLTVADGAQDFIVGDEITFVVEAGDDAGKYGLVDESAVDGKQDAELILAEDADATDDDVTSVAYAQGRINKRRCYVADGSDVDNHVETLAARGLILEEAAQT